MVAPPLRQRFFRPRRHLPFIIAVFIALAFFSGEFKKRVFEVPDKSAPVHVDKRSLNAPYPPYGAHTPRMEALLRERNLYDRLVSRVIDGDTVEVRDKDGARFKVRLYGSDAPETEKPKQEGQPFGEEAFTALRNKVEGKRVDIEVVEIDRYGRAIAIVRQDGRNINIEMVSDGLAECYMEYLEGPQKKECSLAEAFAKRLKKGMWALKNYERPNDFRKRMREEQG